MKTLAMLLLAVSGAAAAQGDGDPLRPLLACTFGGELKPVSASRLNTGAAWRTVETSAGPMRVSTADGYRMMLAFPDSEPFVNLKLERPAAGRLSEDRTAILAQMTSFAARPGAHVEPFKVAAHNGVEVMALNNGALTGGVISMYTLISEKSNVVATAYLLNPKPERRKFKSYAEYEALRDAFIASLSQCMADRPALISIVPPIPPQS
ncbi:MAG: hypothetical protein V4463_24695 [Pseudomonadota bacterium]